MPKPSKSITTGAQTTAAIPAINRPSLINRFAGRYAVDPTKLLSTLKSTAFRQKGKNGQPPVEVTDEQMMALLVVADEYKLNPFTREIYAFPSDVGIVPIISVDGWIRIINQRPEFLSMTFLYAEEGSDNPWIECTIERKDRTAPTVVREYLNECIRDTGPWKSHPRRMLRHKVLIQCARVAFGFGGLYDPDEGERIVATIEAQPQIGKPHTEAPQAIQPPPAAPASVGKVYNEVPIAELRDALNAEGIPENALFAKFEIGGYDELPLNRVNEALHWVRNVNAPA